MNIDKIKKEQEFGGKVLNVFESIERTEKMFLKDIEDPLVNLFSAFYYVNKKKVDLLFTNEEVMYIREFIDNIDEIWIDQPIQNKRDAQIIPFPYISLNDQSIDYTIFTNEREFYKRLLKTFIEYKKTISQFWSETDMYNLLIEKNKKYGDAVLNPTRILSNNISIKDVILSRIDEKLSRLMQDHKNEDEDIITDIIGYLIFINILLLD